MTTVVNLNTKPVSVLLHTLPIGTGFYVPETKVHYIKCQTSKDDPQYFKVFRVHSESSRDFPRFEMAILHKVTNVVPVNIEINIS